MDVVHLCRSPGTASTSYCSVSAPCRVSLRAPLRLRAAGVVLGPSAPAQDRVAEAKRALLASIQYTRRGSNTTKELRGRIEEAQVALEACSPTELDYGLLAGKWRLVYTTAPDVLPILGLDQLQLPRPLTLSPIDVGNIYQRFSSVEEGIVENIIEFGVAPFLEPGNGATLTVTASYEVRSPKRIALTFQEAELGRVRMAPALQAVLAPAVLPRGDWNRQLLMGIQQLQVRVPFRTAQQVAAARPVAASYLLTYLDSTMLIGRASTPTGVFVFEREGAPGV